MSPYDKLCAAIAIIQDHILASDSMLSGEAMFPSRRLTTASLELAERLLDEITEHLEGVDQEAA